MAVDLRSDTVTKPSEAMRRAMSAAEVGDDWYGDDPTVNRLQQRAADITGKEAALYVATGTMANRIAHHMLVRSGHLVVCEEFSHVNTVELHSAAVLSGISYRPVPSERGRLTAEAVAHELLPDPLNVRVVDLISLENTHQIGGGTALPLEDVRDIGKVAADAGVAVYLDGARIFNASAASGVAVSEYAAEVEALMFCLSKGLGAPIGSVLCGSRELIAEARRTKILFGGAWRQAGIMAAAGLIALEEGPKRLHEDHDRARRLAEGIAEATPEALDPSYVETNIVFADPGPLRLSAVEAVTALRAGGVLCNPLAGRVRFVTHLDVDDAGIADAIAAWRALAEESP
ncbi:MAG: aminotransferase class I/II-fold pyridoxal phosphate-dependent enzyme [Actinobacteria bacterium]|nr:aminotransferase class I/II-fold pyridoxal phosphate-dependent enzyme [Actinomycetota bacterium]